MCCRSKKRRLQDVRPPRQHPEVGPNVTLFQDLAGMFGGNELDCRQSLAPYSLENLVLCDGYDQAQVLRMFAHEPLRNLQSDLAIGHEE
jgi:hypothetical protein